MSSNTDNFLLEIKTVQSNAIRILFESLKDILTDVNLQISSNGIKIMAMDGSKVAVIHLKLDANKFEIFKCQKPMKAGINMSSLHKILKSIKNNDVINFYIKENESTNLNIKIENTEKRTQIISVIKLLDIDEDILEIPNIEYDSVVTMPSNDFQSYVRDLSIITNEIKIESKDSSFILSGQGDFAGTNIIIGETSNGMTLNKQESASGVFFLKYLLLFTKSTNLCTTVELYLKNEYPLILIYKVANLGQLKYCLAPKFNSN